MTGKVYNLINELPQASIPRAEEILTFLDEVLSDIECNFPSEEESDEAYVCQNIPLAQELIESIRALNTKGNGEEYVESTKEMIKNLSAQLGSVFCQI